MTTPPSSHIANASPATDSPLAASAENLRQAWASLAKYALRNGAIRATVAK